MPTPKKKVKYLRLCDKSMFISALHYFITTQSSSTLVSLAVDRACKNFVKELETIPLSEELQNFKPKPNKK